MPMASVIKPGISNKTAASRYMVPAPSDCSAEARCGPSTTFMRSTCPPPPNRSISAPTSDVAKTASSAQKKPIQIATTTNSTISANGSASTAVSNHMATFMVYRLSDVGGSRAIVYVSAK
jgi:Tfp pilus assembly protein PilX